MSKVGPEARSYLPIEREDLIALAEIARRDREDYFQRKPAIAELYAQRVLCIALCQGAALHFIDGETGINDFDVYTFYRVHPQKQWYPRRIKSYDFGNPKFGHSVDRPDFSGRRVDCLGRAIDAGEGEDVVSALRRYLQAGKTKTARLLAAKAVVLLEPHCGTIVWPVEAER
ncbi:MAG: hypothetical protein M5R40_23340 [Anaerolineae bacterium]|nr:hypothetical protein [Anaerolineae bacterium]